MQILVQMSGVPGSGKSTIARAIAPSIGALILDHDDTKSAILEVGIANDLAGQASYSVLKVLVTRFLSEGHNVVIDSPCLYAPLLDFGVRTAREFGAAYKYIECQLRDLRLLDERLRQRSPKPSQMKYIEPMTSHGGNPPRESKALIRDWAANMKRPENDYLVLDATKAVEKCVEEALNYVRT